MARPRRDAAICRRATQCRHCQQMTATYFARAEDGRAWYLCANPACRRMHELPAPEPSVESRSVFPRREMAGRAPSTKRAEITGSRGVHPVFHHAHLAAVAGPAITHLARAGFWTIEEAA